MPRICIEANRDTEHYYNLSLVTPQHYPNPWLDTSPNTSAGLPRVSQKQCRALLHHSGGGVL